MVYIGIDIAKNKHDCCFIDISGKALCRFTITNTRQGFNQFLEHLQMQTIHPSQVIIGLEATGHYGAHLKHFLHQKGFTFYELNPLAVNFHRHDTSIRKAKTDRIDAKLIADYVRSKHQSLTPSAPTSYHSSELKSLCRYRMHQIQDLSQRKVQLRKLIYLLFPELETLTRNLHSATVYAILTAYPGCTKLAKANLAKLTNIVIEASRGQYGRGFAISVQQAAKGSIGVDSMAAESQLQLVLKDIAIYQERIRYLDLQIASLMQQFSTTITTIPGVSITLGATILSELGDLARFRSASQILAFAGLVPSVYQSGEYQSKHAHMEKRGSKYLRYALFHASKALCQNDPEFALYLSQKRQEGKHYFVALSHAMRKLIRIILALHRTGQPYHKKTMYICPKIALTSHS